MTEANQFCQSQGKYFHPIERRGSSSGDMSQLLLTFKCLYGNDPEYTSRGEWRTVPDTVIEDRR